LGGRGLRQDEADCLFFGIERTNRGSEKHSMGDQSSRISGLVPGAISLGIDCGTWSDQSQYRRRYLWRLGSVSTAVPWAISPGIASG